MRMRRVLCGLGLVLLSSAARADTGAVGVLGVEAVGVGDDLAAAVSGALRKVATKALGARALIGKDLIELKFVFGCDGEEPTCLAQAGHSLGAEKLMYGSLRRSKKQRDAIVVDLKLLDVVHAVVSKSVHQVVLRTALTGPALDDQAARWLDTLLPPPPGPKPVSLKLDTQPHGAQVSIDGVAVGVTPLFRPITPGSHVLSLEHAGFVTAQKNISVAAGDNVALDVVLEALPVGVVKRDDLARPVHARAPGRPAKWAALGMLIGAVATGAAALGTWRAYVDLQDSTHRQLDDIAAHLTAAPTDADRAFFAAPGCTPPSGLSSSTSIAMFSSDCRCGQTVATTTAALWGVSGALAASSAIAFGIGVGLDKKAHASTKTGRLELVPLLTPSSASLQLHF